MVTPCVFYNKARDITTLVHGDDFATAAEEKELNWLQTQLEYKFKTKSKTLGTRAGQEREISILNRIVKWTSEGIQYEADPRHAELIIQHLGLEGAKGCKTQWQNNETDGDEEELTAEQQTRYRAVAARMNYLAQDRVDIQYATKEVCRGMAKPTKEHWRKLKQLGRYLIYRPRFVWTFRWVNKPGTIKVYTDANWAGCQKTRRSTSSGCLMIGPHTIKTWSRTQHGIALSSAEAELYAAGRGAQEGRGLQQLLEGVKVKSDVQLYMDAKAAIAIIQREGLGKMRHIGTHWLWLQKLRENRAMDFVKIWGEKNPADAGTKYLTADKIEEHTTVLGATFADGRADAAPHTATTNDKHVKSTITS